MLSSSLSGIWHQILIVPLALAFICLEYLASIAADHDEHTHDARESAVSILIWLGQALVRLAEAGLIALPFLWLYTHRLFEFRQLTAPTLVALFLGVEFLYYWQHRASHRIRWLWATHRVHHSATHMNLTAGIRLGWTGNLSGHFLFYLPLAWIGFHPALVVAMLSVSLIYQFFIHTELVGSLGPLDWILNTPRHHCVHHAKNPACLDKNYGGTLIIFDRMFGTFAEAPAEEPLSYGLVGHEPTHHPLKVVFGEWIAMGRDLLHAPTLRARCQCLFALPGSSTSWPEPANPQQNPERSFPHQQGHDHAI
jgi:sterol desaturase/sphingolipid hydroxylase (fatty acid hydroxylase superfamily)